MDPNLTALLGGFLFVVLVMAVLLRILLRPGREPESRVAWVVIVLALPLAGVIAYFILGEVRIGRGRLARLQQAQTELPGMDKLCDHNSAIPVNIPDRYAHLFQLGKSISGYQPVGGNRATLPKDSNQTIDWIEADIDAAQEHVHVMFYIWLEDRNGCRIAQALARAAARGVQCRAMADGLGSRQFLRSSSWKLMRDAGVELRTAMAFGALPLRPLRSRIDIRNHRKVVIIDNHITYCGSQNCADPEFRIKARFAPWVDIMLRLEGPISMQNQHLFAVDWMAEKGDSLKRQLTSGSWHNTGPGTVAQVVATGPTCRESAVPELFVALIYSARRELLITTPYYVPNRSIQDALCASARRGVETTIILPARNDSRFVAAASRSHYADLLEAGVNIYDYPAGLLHAKTLTIDGEACLVGSANMDRRSFELNFENNMLIYDTGLTQQIRAWQLVHRNASIHITRVMLQRWSWLRRLWNNVCAILSPVL